MIIITSKKSTNLFDIDFPEINLPNIYKDYGIKGLNSTDRYDDKKRDRKPIPPGLKIALIIRSKGKCENPKCKIDFEELGLNPDLHHKNQKPDDNRKANIIVLCPNCHRKIHNKYSDSSKASKKPKSDNSKTRKKPKSESGKTRKKSKQKIDSGFDDFNPPTFNPPTFNPPKFF